jgi:EmrB/QacA subfamily drug resistance transporter
LELTELKDRKYILIITSISSFTTPFMGSAINLALPSMGIEFSLNAVLLGWIATSFLLATAALLLPAGRLADIYGRTILFKIGLGLYTLASLFCGLSYSGEVLIISRILQGIGAAMLFSTSTAILVSFFPSEERGKVLGINTAAVYSGLSSGPFIGGLITQHFGWRYIFFINVLMGLLSLIIAFRKLKYEWAEAKGEKFDLAGSIAYGVTLVIIMYGFSVLPNMYGSYLIILGVSGFYIFSRFELKVSNPVFTMNLFTTNKAFAYSNLAALINYSATFAVGFLLSFYLQYIKGFNPQTAGIILVSQPIIMAIFSPISGKISDKVEPRIVASAGMIITTMGLFILIFLKTDTSLVFIITSLVFLGFGFALFSSPNTNAVLSSVDKKFLGVASSTLSTMRLTGQMFSMGLALLIISIFMGKAKITPDNTNALLSAIGIAFILFTILCFAGIFASLARGRIRECNS